MSVTRRWFLNTFGLGASAVAGSVAMLSASPTVEAVAAPSPPPAINQYPSYPGYETQAEYRRSLITYRPYDPDGPLI
jgi:hypothetical protein